MACVLMPLSGGPSVAGIDRKRTELRAPAVAGFRDNAAVS